MNLQPLLESPPAVLIHVATVIPAFALGAWLIFGSRKGTAVHKTAGKVFLALMVIAAVSAIFIKTFIPLRIDLGVIRLGPIHLLVALVFWNVYKAFATVKAGDIPGHQKTMKGMFYGALVVAGAFAFFPGRVMWRMFFE